LGHRPSVGLCRPLFLRRRRRPERPIPDRHTAAGNHVAHQNGCLYRSTGAFSFFWLQPGSRRITSARAESVTVQAWLKIAAAFLTDPAFPLLLRKYEFMV
jgi:hypothetical protein